MDRTRIGSLSLPRLVLGCGNFGGVGSAPAFFGRGETEVQAIELMDRAWEAGIDAFDTADAYGGGRSETWIGRWLRAKGARVRERLVLTSKVFHPVAPGDGRGLARDRVLRQVEASLARLQTDHLDLYLMHEWDPETPLEETLGAFDELVRSGKVRHFGASNVTAEQVSRALGIGAQHGGEPLRCVQNSFSLLDRAAERELLPACAARGVAFTAFSPLAGGWLTGKYRAGRPYPAGSRMTLRPEPYLHLASERVFRGLATLEAAARERGVAPGTLALAWVLARPHVAAAGHRSAQSGASRAGARGVRAPPRARGCGVDGERVLGERTSPPRSFPDRGGERDGPRSSLTAARDSPRRGSCRPPGSRNSSRRRPDSARRR